MAGRVMKYVKISILILTIGLLAACSFPERKVPPRQKPVIRKNIRLPEIVLRHGQNHQFTFTNKVAGFFVGNSHRYNTSGFEGWTVNEVHIFRDYRIFRNGRELRRKHLKLFRYLPYRSERVYRDGTVERFTLFDSINACLVAVKAPGSKDFVELQPLGLKLKSKTLPGPDAPIIVQSVPALPHTFLRIDYLRARKKIHLFLFRLVSSAQTDTLKREFLAKLDTLVMKRKLRFRRLLNRFPVRVKNQRLQNALKWALISLDALVTRQRGPGIWAGLPWFNNYWGRDTFISLPGALLVSGQFEQAKRILENFARFQLTDENNPLLGRIPNRITNEEIIYNTADGTWWFIRALYEYYLFTGDRAFLKAMFPHVRLAIQGAIKYRTDANGYLTHGDAETWMDAVGSEGPWSPRGNRAVEIQALWYTALHIGARCARFLHTDQEEAARWLALAEKLRENFNRDFWDSTRQGLFDHLNADGSPDRALRPNQIFAVTVPELDDIPPLLTKSRQQAVARLVTEQLTTRHGVLSLWYRDRNFHPYHHYLPYYPPDAAYHNGLIWSWLAGPVLAAQLKFNQIFAADTLFLDEARQIMRYDAIGNFAELLEPVLRKGQTEPRVSGAISQAWSLAEFLRIFYRDVVGYRPLAHKNQIEFKPHLPPEVPEVRCRLPYKNGFLDAYLQRTETGCRLRLHSSLPRQRIDGRAFFENDSIPVTIFLPDSGTDFTYEYISADTTADSVKIKQQWKLARIDAKRSFAVIHDLPFRLLKPKEVYFPLGHNGPTLIYARDALNDDRGFNGKYTYPLNKVFVAGIADVKSLTVYDNGKYWGFRIDLRRVINPNWHPEYGFQLTYLAIALRDEQLGGVLGRDVNHEARVRLPAARAFNRVIYVGGGLEIRDAQNQKIALFVPVDRRHPLGFPAYGQIRFQIPKSLLPGLNARTPITVLVGLQDDHGGSGLGDFRAVLPKADQWHGGGASGKNAPAVYDLLEIN